MFLYYRIVSLPEEGAKVDFMGGTIRRKATCFFLRIPKELSGGPREWTVERRFRGDVTSAWEKALQTLEAKLGAARDAGELLVECECTDEPDDACGACGLGCGALA